MVIYDAQACRALKMPTPAYDTYLQGWLAQQYRRHEEAIRSTCIRLASGLTIPEAHKVLGCDWFHHRVFDQLLWTKGRPST